MKNLNTKMVALQPRGGKPRMAHQPYLSPHLNFKSLKKFLKLFYGIDLTAGCWL
jgi:hypothetical protein